jgi:hypothetical protein
MGPAGLGQDSCQMRSIKNALFRRAPFLVRGEGLPFQRTQSNRAAILNEGLVATRFMGRLAEGNPIP